MPKLTKEEMISEIEDAYYKFYEDNPNEPMGDIPDGMFYLRSSTMHEVEHEYNNRYIRKIKK